MKKPTVSIAQYVAPFIEKVSKLTKVQKILICVGVVLLMTGPMVYWVYMPKHQRISELTTKYESLSAELEKYKLKAKQINKLRQEAREVEAQFEIARQALPESEEIPSLLTNISHAGQDSGLEFILFKPEQERAQGFYSEIPVSIRVTGRYHDAARFFDEVSRLSRIVNIKDIRMAAIPAQKMDAEADRDKLDISCTAVTYKFLETASATNNKDQKQ